MDFVNPLLQWLNANPQWAGFVTFLISAGESVAIVGTIVPGSITMTAIGTLAGAGIIPLWATLFWATLGAIVGDGISYWMGFYFKDRLRTIWPFRNNPGILKKGEVFVHKYGITSVFIGRFIGPIRAIVPLVAGMLGMKPLQFTVANVASAIGWAPAYMLPGILLGAASLELPSDIALHVILALLLILLFIILCLWLVYKILQLISQQTEHMLIRIWKQLKKSRYFHVATVILKHHDPQQHHGQLILTFYFLLNSFVLFLLMLYVKWIGPSHILVNDALFHFFRGIRSPSIDNIMIAITLLGEKQVVMPVVLVMMFWLIAIRRVRAAFHTLALGILASSSVFVIKHFIQIERPWGILQNIQGFGFAMPSGHTVFATTIYMGIAFILAISLAPKRRWIIYTPAALVSFAVGISRVYLGAHWFTDVVAAWLLSAALLMLVMLSFHRHYEKPISLLGSSLICSIALLISYLWFYSSHVVELQKNYEQLDWSSAQVSIQHWWKEDEIIPDARVSLFGFPSQNINIQWAGDLTKIRNTLLKEGWTSPPPRDWISFLHRLTDIKSTQFLPLISPQYLDKTPALILIKRIGKDNKIYVLRLWAANRTFMETNIPLWIGTFGMIPRSFSWLSRKRQIIDPQQNAILSPQAKKQWQWKMINVPFHTIKHKIIEQKVLLIKPTNTVR